MRGDCVNIRAFAPILNVEHLETSVAFYTTRLGFSVCEAGPGWATLACGPARLVLNVPETADSTLRRIRKTWRDAVLYFWIEDVETLHASLLASAVRISPLIAADRDDAGASSLIEFTCRDPDGYELAFGGPRQT
jgi:catechol 2,3-dioxygenase-like lactoylglutathione lyase family enzyme